MLYSIALTLVVVGGLIALIALLAAFVNMGLHVNGIMSDRGQLPDFRLTFKRHAAATVVFVLGGVILLVGVALGGYEFVSHLLTLLEQAAR